MDQVKSEDNLEGTTLRVFRFVYRQRQPARIHDIQRGLELSSPSVAYYHVSKLLKAGLLRDEGEGYTVDKAVFENMVRIHKTALPIQTAYAVFFLTSLIALITILRPAQLSSTYVFAVVAIVVGLFISTIEAYKVARTPY